MEISKLNSVCKIFGGYAFPSSSYVEREVPLIRISNVRVTNEIVVDNNVSIKYNERYSNYIIKNQDILIALSGATTGKFGIYNSDEISYLNQRVGLLRANKSINQRYLFYYLNLIQEEILRKASGVAQPNISTNQLGEFQIPLPSLEIQKAIAEKLDKADALRKKDQELLKHYDDLAQSIFIDMFGDPVQNEKDWKVDKIENIAKKEKNSIKAGPFGSSLKKEYYVEKGYKIYGQEQVIKDDLSFGNYYIDEKKYKELESCKVKANDILISLVGTYGKISIIPELFEKGIINPRLMKISPDIKIVRPDFIKFQLQGDFVRKQLERVSRGGTMDIINVGIMKEILIQIPPIELQNQFAEKIKNIETQKALVKKQAEESENLFQALLQESFSFS